MRRDAGGGPTEPPRPPAVVPDSGTSVPRRAVIDGAQSALRDAALDYAARGWPVFPCQAGGKTPLTRHGFKDASSHREHVWQWWARWPAANIAIPTGPASGWLVVDLDGPQGEASWRRLCDRYGQCSTLQQSTGRGRHLVFAHPAGVALSNTAGRLGPGVDTRGDGGYVVVAPSRHPSGRRYRWLRPGAYRAGDPSGSAVLGPLSRQQRALPCPPAPAPGWLVELLLPPKPKPAIPRVPVASAGAGAELVSWLARQGEGNRNRGLFWAACRALERGLGGDVLDRLQVAATDAGLTECEAARTIASARRHKGLRDG